MGAPSLALARACVEALCLRHGVTLVTPDSYSPVRTLVRASIAAVTPLTLAEVDTRVSFYVPRLVRELHDFVPDPVRALVAVEAPAVYLSARAWGDPVMLVGVGAHEVGHHLQDERAREAAGVVGSVVHGAAYLFHETVRSDSEVTCYTHDLTAQVVVGDADPDAYRIGIVDVLRSSYVLAPHAVDHAATALRSAVASLRARQLPGVGTPLHEMLRALVAGGWDPGPWASVIGGERVTAVPS